MSGFLTASLAWAVGIASGRGARVSDYPSYGRVPGPNRIGLIMARRGPTRDQGAEFRGGLSIGRLNEVRVHTERRYSVRVSKLPTHSPDRLNSTGRSRRHAGSGQPWQADSIAASTARCPAT